MTRIFVIGFVTLLTACGVDGEPEPPKVSASQTFGVSSSSGGFTKTRLTIEFGS